MDENRPIEEQETRRFSRRFRRLMRRFRRSERGTAVIEFGILAFPFFLLVFATIEAFIAFAGEQLLANAVDTMSRQLRTGQITFNMGRPTDMTEAQFRSRFCEEISLMITCTNNDTGPNQKLYLDVRSFGNFSGIPTYIPKVSNDDWSDLDPSGFAYAPGGPGTINVVRAYYRWEVMTDLVRPYITNIRPNGQTPTDYMMVATTAFRNEAYP